MIGAVVLAAGESRRMGAPKLLLPFRGTTILECLLRVILKSPIDRTVVVLGAYEDRLRPILAAYPVEIVVNPEYPSGMLSSVIRGLRSLPAEAEAALIFPGDQPGVSTETIGRTLAAYRRTGKGLVLPVRAGRGGLCGPPSLGRGGPGRPPSLGQGGHPLLLDMKYRDAVEGLDPGLGLRSILSLHAGDVERVEAAEDSGWLDIDTPGDYRRALAAEGEKH